MKQLYSWLQISDLHIFNSTDWNIMTDAYEQLSTVIQPDFLVVTGDFRHKVKNTNYNDALDFLNKVVKMFNLKKSNVFLVPGNHDVNSFRFKEEIINTINNNIENDPDIYCKYMIDSPCLRDSFDEYINFINQFYDNEVNDDRIKKCIDVFCVTWKNKVNILALNTALISSGRENEKEILDIKQLSEINICNDLPTIVLSHYDINSIAESHQKRLNYLLAKLNTKAFLCGDKHKITKETVDKYDVPNSIIPVIICGKSSIEVGDDFSDLSVIQYICKEDGNTYVQVYKYKNNSSKESNDFYYGVNKKYYFPMFDKTSTISKIEKPAKKQQNKKRNTKKKKHLSIWLPDAELAKGTQTRFNSFTLTEGIKKYLDNDSEFLGISSVKGIGKTFLLQVKRVKSYRKYYCLPKCNKPSIQNNWATERVSFDTYTKFKTENIYDDLVLLWKFSIKCYVINVFLNTHSENLKKADEYLRKKRINKDIYEFCTNKHFDSLESIISNIIDLDDWSTIVNDYNIAIKTLCNIVLNRRKESDKKSKKIAIFIDKVDQSMKQTNAEPPADCVVCSKKDNYSFCKSKKKSLEYCSSDTGCQSKNCCYGCELFASNKSNSGLRIYENSNVSKLAHINIWQYLQLALMNAAGQIYGDFQGEISVFYTIRQEAFNCEDKRLGEQNQKIISNVFYLSYTMEEQEKIFLDCINQQDSNYLFDSKSKGKNNPEYVFVGVEKLCHPYCFDINGNNQEESVFNSIYRHSFDRSRDIQRYGENLTSIIPFLKECSDIHDREEKVKETIEDTAAELAYCSRSSENTANPSYYTEKMKYLPNYWADNENFEKLLSLIDRNLLFENDVKRICKEINGIDSCPKTGCKNGKCSRHPFSMLYSMGYLGYILTNKNNTTCEKQQFLDSKEVCYFIEKDDLNTNERVAYIVHPALTKTIEKKYNKSFMHFSGFILGKGLKVETSIISDMIKDKKTLSKEDFENKYYHKP